jgi:hypothetical protein
MGCIESFLLFALWVLVFRPAGACALPTFPHRLRRELHSYSASRLRSVGDPLGHQIAVVVFEAHAAVEFDGGVAVIHFQVDYGDAELAGLLGEEFQGLRADSLAAMRQ